jgi:outer membrane protein OmpA-like peptidoglycan-associated protein
MRARYLSFAIAAVCFLAVGGCAKRTTAPMAGTTSGGVNTGNPGGMTNPPGSEIIAPRKDTWTFDAAPEPAPSRTPMYRLNEIAFAANSTAFNPEGNGVCRDTAELLKRSNSRILLLGWAHKSESGGVALGRSRAEKVRDCFKGHGIDVNRFEISSFGSRYSVAEATTEPMQVEQERRVEIWVLSE